MSPKYKTILIQFFVTGIIFGAFMAAFDYYDTGSFNWLKFAVMGIGFGSFNAILAAYNYNKQKADKQ
ncbi:MAG: hypothetical protein IR153_08785 [Flavobacterium sp.]|nr:hypothetical protein [Flavobacterium sp.]